MENKEIELTDEEFIFIKSLKYILTIRIFTYIIYAERRLICEKQRVNKIIRKKRMESC